MIDASGATLAAEAWALDDLQQAHTTFLALWADVPPTEDPASG